MCTDGRSLRLLRLILAVVALGATLLGPRGTAMAMVPIPIVAADLGTSPAMPCHEADGTMRVERSGPLHAAGLMQGRAAPEVGFPARIHSCCVFVWLALAPFGESGLAPPSPGPLGFSEAAPRSPAGWTLAIPEPPPRPIV